MKIKCDRCGRWMDEKNGVVKNERYGDESSLCVICPRCTDDPCLYERLNVSGAMPDAPFRVPSWDDLSAAIGGIGR
jgi:hypothetical protein